MIISTDTWKQTDTLTWFRFSAQRAENEKTRGFCSVSGFTHPVACLLEQNWWVPVCSVVPALRWQCPCPVCSVLGQRACTGRQIICVACVHCSWLDLHFVSDSSEGSKETVLIISLMKAPCLHDTSQIFGIPFNPISKHQILIGKA